MKNIILVLIVMSSLYAEVAEAQVIRVRPGMCRARVTRIQREKNPRNKLPKFERAVLLSFGYGFPNLDKEQLISFANYSRGSFSQTGPITGAIDYRFSRMMSIGIMVTHGKVTVPYTAFNGNSAIKGSLENWAFMLNFVRYIPVPNKKISPYLRTALGVNSWKESYTDESGANLNFFDPPTDFAYQAGIGANFSLSKNAGFFIEAGYGKYILHGGLSFRF